MTDDPAVRVRAWLDAPTWLPESADDLRAVLDELDHYRNAINWDTSCLNCARLLDRCREADERVETAEAQLPIRPDGAHHYVSTYCLHGDHAACRRVCKSCPAECACDCGHPKTEAAKALPLPAADLRVEVVSGAAVMRITHVPSGVAVSGEDTSSRNAAAPLLAELARKVAAAADAGPEAEA